VRHKVEGKAHRYIPRVAQKNARRTVLGRLIDKLFDGSPEQLLAHLVDDHDLTPAQVKRMRDRLRSSDRRGGAQ
jgi:predicted transcriptional regulator